ncbi:transcriptional regulator [Undibacterium sp. Rencai35W]|uniref:transcriptional regulator n=1 Tax=Undibacterium sp. Rencai35W TaxID=3413046 RepID=UPI003BF06B8A
MNLSTYILLERGNATRLAAHLGVGPSYISQLASGHRRPSARLSTKIEEFTSKKVTRQELRQDDWQEIWPDLNDQVTSAT